ncbi:hypothetical protein CLAIMM_04541 [Cladophialophora immunda]|nr:hypothetical protein CLAIMM_04541 [Cladophialophora immunda]
MTNTYSALEFCDPFSPCDIDVRVNELSGELSTSSVLLSSCDYQNDPRSFLETTPSLSISSELKLSKTEIMTQYFFEQLVMSGTWLSLLPQLYIRSCENSALRHSIRAASLLLLGNQAGDHGAIGSARKFYGRCLNLLNVALDDDAQKLKDETFWERSVTSGSHLRACKSLLLQRASQQHSASTNSKVANSLVIQAQAYVLKHYPEWSELCEEQVCHRASAEPAAEILRCCLAVGKLRTSVENLSNVLVGSATNIQMVWLDALQGAEEIDRRFEEWERSLTGRWLPMTTSHSLSDVLDATMDFYNDIQVGKVWNQYRCARIALHELIIEIVENVVYICPSSRQNVVPKVKRSAQTITNMLSAICDSIPFHLQRVDSRGQLVTQTAQRVLGGEHLLWPLDVVLHSRWSNNSQRTQAHKALEEIGTSLGLKQASKTIQREQEAHITLTEEDFYTEFPAVIWPAC